MTASISEIFDAAAVDMRASGFKDSAVFTPAAGDPVSLMVDLIIGIDYQPGGLEAQVWGTDKAIEYLFADIGREVDEDEVFTIDEVDYTVQKVVENDGWFVKVAVK